MICSRHPAIFLVLAFIFFLFFLGFLQTEDDDNPSVCVKDCAGWTRMENIGRTWSPSLGYAADAAPTVDLQTEKH